MNLNITTHLASSLPRVRSFKAYGWSKENVFPKFLNVDNFVIRQRNPAVDFVRKRKAYCIDIYIYIYIYTYINERQCQSVGFIFIGNLQLKRAKNDLHKIPNP